ncbi:MAG: TonB-dependent receptor [Gemmatimonadota bacterium]|jgi:outer membrane receptor protein involved in Fe transport
MLVPLLLGLSSIVPSSDAAALPMPGITEPVGVPTATVVVDALASTFRTGRAAAADTLRGRVTGPGGAALGDAHVTVVELATGVRTAADGSWALALPAGRYTLLIEREGYASVTRTVTTPSLPLSVSLAESVYALEPVTVTATRAPMASPESALPVTVMGQESLRREHDVSLARAVSSLAGVHAVTTGEQIGKPIVRGLSGPRVLVLENGHRLEDYSWSDEDGPSIDSRLQQRIEVIRGPASVLYGSDAIGGVINAVPAPLPDATVGGSYRRGQAEVLFGSNNMELGSALRYEGASGRIGWRGFAIGRFAEDLHTPAGKLDNTGFGALDGEFEIGLHSRRGTSVLRYSRYGGEFKLLEAGGPVPGTQQEEEEGGPERKLSDDRVQFDGNYLVGPFRLETKAQWQRHFIAELSDDLSQPGRMIETEVFNLVLNTLTADVMLHNTGDRLNGTVGASVFRQNNDTRGLVPLVPDADITTYAGFVFEQYTMGRLSLLGGARGEHRAVDAQANADLQLDARSLAWNTVAGNAGAVLSVADGLSLAANVGRAWRAPNLFELFTNGPRLGEARYEIGDPDLVEETSVNVDGSVRLELPRVRGEVSAYRNRIDKYIFATPTTQFQDGLRMYRYGQADATLVGGEASVEFVPTDALSLRGRYDVVKATNEETDEPLPLIPARSGSVEAEVHRARVGWADQTYAGLEVEIVADKTRWAPEEMPTDGYALLNLEAGGRHTFGRRTLRLDLRVRNLTNEAYTSFLSRYKEFATDPGRNLMLRLSTDF